MFSGDFVSSLPYCKENVKFPITVVEEEDVTNYNRHCTTHLFFVCVCVCVREGLNHSLEQAMQALYH
jgi:hypothetical protein